MHPAHVNCPHCGQQYTVTPDQMASYAGEAITCSRCGKPFAMAMPDDASASTAPAVVAQASAQQAAGSPSLQYAGAHDAPRTSGLSIASLVCGCLLCIPFVPGILAIVLGWLGIRQSNRDERIGGKGLAIAGLVLGIVNVLFYLGYLALVFAITVPMTRNARVMANQSVCRNNLQQLALGLQMYANNHAGAYPPALDTLVEQGLVTANVLTCPDAPPGATAPSYHYVRPTTAPASAADPDTIILYEHLADHPTGAHLVTGDHLVQFLPTDQAKAKLAEQGITPEESPEPPQ